MNLLYKTIYKHPIFLMLITMFFFKPSILDYDSSLASLNMIINRCKVIITVSIVLGHIIDRKYKIQYKSFLMPIIIFFIWIIFTTYLGHESVQHVILNSLYAIAFSIFVYDGMVINKKATVMSILSVLLMWEIINFVIYQFFPDGIVRSAYYANKIHFLGGKNSFSGYVIPVLILSFIANKYRYCNGIIHWFAIIISVLTMIISNSSTGITSVIILIVISLFQNARNKTIYKYRFYILGAFVISIGVVFFRIQNYFGFIIEELFGKGLDLTNRTTIWDFAIQQIKLNPFIGSGMNTNTGTILIGNTYYYSHNLILEILVSSGIIGLLLYFNIFRSSLKFLIRNIKDLSGSRDLLVYEKKIALIGLLSFLITSIVEAPVFKLYFFLCIVLINMNE